MTEKNIFVDKYLILVYFFCKNCTLPEKRYPLFSLSKVESCQPPPPFENLVGGSSPPPPPAERGVHTMLSGYCLPIRFLESESEIRKYGDTVLPSMYHF